MLNVKRQGGQMKFLRKLDNIIDYISDFIKVCLVYAGFLFIWVYSVYYLVSPTFRESINQLVFGGLE